MADTQSKKIALVNAGEQKRRRAPRKPKPEEPLAELVYKGPFPEPWHSLFISVGGVFLVFFVVLVGCCSFIGKGFEGGFDTALKTYRKGMKGMNRTGKEQRGR